MGDARVGALLDLLAAHRPLSQREEHSLRRTVALLGWLTSPFDEHADPTHVTASAIVLDDVDRVLLHRHRRLGMWLQPGGHLEPGEEPASGAVRETEEETGVATSHPAAGPRLIHVDVHQGPRGHVHLDLRYLLLAPAGARLAPAPGESRDVAWFAQADAVRHGDESLAAAVRAVVTRRHDGPR